MPGPCSHRLCQVLSELTRRLSRLARHAPWHAATHAALSAAQHTGLPCDTRAETAKLGAVAAGGRLAERGMSWVERYSNYVGVYRFIAFHCII